MKATANHALLRLAEIGFISVICMVIYLTIYLPKVKGLIDSSAWNVYCPKVVPSIIVISVTSFLLFIRAIWPVWGFFSPFVIGTQLMGAFMVTHFIPVGTMC